MEKDRGVYEFEVKFNPDLDAKNKRMKATAIVMRELGLPKVFDGGKFKFFIFMKMLSIEGFEI